MRVWKKRVFYAARWMGDPDGVLGILRDSVRARCAGLHYEPEESRTFVASVTGEVLALTMRVHYLFTDEWAKKGDVQDEDLCVLELGQWVVHEESDDQGDSLCVMSDADFRSHFAEVPA